VDSSASGAPAHALSAPPATTIAYEQAEGTPGVTPATATRPSPSPAADTRLDDPWLAAIVLSPSVRRFLTTVSIGVQDYRSLMRLVRKPSRVVRMTFSDRPNQRLPQHRFRGSAIVFVPTVTYAARTASRR
jgi:hypothetical protein